MSIESQFSPPPHATPFGIRERLVRGALLALLLLAGAASAAGIRVDVPEDGAVVYDVNGKVFVDVELGETDLSADLRFRLLLDGQPVDRIKYVPVFHLRDVAPGEHVLQAQVLDRQGKVLQTSEAVRFTMRTTTESDMR